MIPTKERYIIYACIVGFIIYLFCVNGASILPQKPVDQITIVNEYDSTLHNGTSTVSVPVTIKEGVNNLPAPIVNILSDTNLIKALGENSEAFKQVAQALKDYYSIKEQKVTTISNDSLHTVVATNTLTKNTITGSNTMVQCFKPITTITIEKAPPLKNKLFIGANLEAGKTGFKNIGPELSLLTKRDMLYQTEWNVLEAVHGDPYSFNVSAAWLISFGKKKNRQLSPAVPSHP